MLCEIALPLFWSAEDCSRLFTYLYHFEVKSLATACRARRLCIA